MDELTPNTLKKRLLYVFDQYRQRRPEVALYTGDAVVGVLRGGAAQPTYIAQYAVARPLGERPDPHKQGIALALEDAAEATGRQMTPQELLDWMRAEYLEAGVWYTQDSVDEHTKLDKLVPWVAKVIADAPDAMRAAREIRGGLDRIADWAAATRPADLMSLGWTQAKYRSDRWHAGLERERKKKAVPGEIVYRFSDGWSVHGLRTREHLISEGDAMGHCVGRSPTYAAAVERGASAIYSLRDSEGVPHITMEVAADRNGNVLGVRQVKGEADRPVGLVSKEAQREWKEREEEWFRLAGSRWEPRETVRPRVSRALQQAARLVDKSECARVTEFLGRGLGLNQEQIWAAADMFPCRLVEGLAAESGLGQTPNMARIVPTDDGGFELEGDGRPELTPNAPRAAMDMRFGRTIDPDEVTGRAGQQLDKAMDRYEIFHAKKPIRVVELPHDLPDSWVCVAQAESIMYRTDKWHADGDDEDYKHVHEPAEKKHYHFGEGVKLYEPASEVAKSTVAGQRRAAPARPQRLPAPKPEVIEALGYCLGFFAKRFDDEEVYEVNPRGSWVFASPDGHMLTVYSPRQGFLCAMAGGKLRVLKDGIDG